MSRNIFKRYRQHVNEVLPISHDTTPYLDVNTVTLTTATATNIDTGLSITSQAQSTAGWSAYISATSGGSYSFELWLTYSDGSRQVLEFVIDVFDD